MSAVLAHAPTTRFRPPTDLTADAPPERRGLRRDSVRLLVADEARLHHTTFSQIGEHLRGGDVLVVNNSATVAREIDATLRGLEPVVLHVGSRLTEDTWAVELRTAPDAAHPVLDARVGDVVEVSSPPEVTVRLRLEGGYPHAGSSPAGQGNRLWRAAPLDGAGLCDRLDQHGRPIAYGYLRARYPLTAYQTVFGVVPGSAEMASAARPFTTGLVTSLVSRGVTIAPITLHTGLSSQEAGEAPQPERYAVGAVAADLVNRARSRGGRVIAVGTTATRAIETAATPDGVVRAGHGWTELVISPDRPVRVVDGLVTGWHDPDASHLLLVESVAGPELTQRAYEAASTQGYAWHEFGDSGLFLPAAPPSP